MLGSILSVVFGTLEAIAATNAITLVPAFRSWGLTTIIVAAVAVAALAILERQSRILDRLEQIEAPRRPISQARRELDALQKRLRGEEGGGSNITPLFPEE
jgi:Na+/H+ antiporter NhaC